MDNEFAAELGRYIVSEAGLYWTETHRPLLLSRLGPNVTSKYPEYQARIKPFRLKQFIETHLKDELKIVTHPDQREKVGIIPARESFSFETSITDIKRRKGWYRLDSVVWRALTTKIVIAHPL